MIIYSHFPGFCGLCNNVIQSYIYEVRYHFTASKSGNTITMTMTYNMRDFYDWNANGTAEIGLVSQGQMNTLHRAGMAKDYKVTGQMKMRIVWNVGQNIGSGATWTIL